MGTSLKPNKITLNPAQGLVIMFRDNLAHIEQRSKIKVNGQIIEALPDTKFKVKLDDGHEILAYLAGKMRLHYIKVMIGDKVSLELSPDGTRGRIIYRF
jgi:translation initiation factor IF-1